MKSLHQKGVQRSDEKCPDMLIKDQVLVITIFKISLHSFFTILQGNIVLHNMVNEVFSEKQANRT